MTARVLIVPEAEEQIRAIERWWHDNAGSEPSAFLDELTTAIALIEEVPEMGSPFRRTKRRGVRRLRLRRSKQWLYYVHDRNRALVIVLAVWSTARGQDPSLP